MELEALDHCPHCLCADGLYTRFTVSYRSYYKFGALDEPFESEPTTGGTGGKVYYCIACDKRVAHIDGTLCD